MKKAILLLAAGGVSLAVAGDAMRTAALKDVRLNGYPGQKLEALIEGRVTGAFAQREVFGEARRAFVERDDDERAYGGLWRGEFWGKQMLSVARVADYLQDAALLRFVREECHRLMALQDEDGYLGSYTDKERVAIPVEEREATRKMWGWYPVWNLWNRKYCIWGMLMAYKATGDRAILASVERQMTQWIDMMHRKGIRLYDSGTYEMNGMPSMSVLKPLLMIYEETGDKKYLDYAEEMLPDWDRVDGACPNFFRNAANGQPLAAWYPDCFAWAKSYEMMSCLDGLLEHYRVTGAKRSLDTVVAIRDNLAASEANPFGSVGFGDKFCFAAERANALNEACDVIHWIRLNLDLFLITGEDRYMDAIESAYVNGYLASIYRDGTWGPFFIRGYGRHERQSQCGYAYNHCCVNNLPRTFMDVASGMVTRDADGVFHVNLYQDAEVTLDGVKFEIAGNYPVGSNVTVKVTAPQPVKVVFRKPGWCEKMNVAQSCATTGRVAVYALDFDMNARLVERTVPHRADDTANWKNWPYRRYTNHWIEGINSDLLEAWRTDVAAQVMWGPLVLTKARRVGARKAEIMDQSTVNGKGYALKVTPVAADGVWGAWDVELTKPDEKTVRVKACDFPSAGDSPYADEGIEFSIWW